MAQHDYEILNDSGINVRNDINNVLQAIVSNNSGLSPPAGAVAGTLWFDISVQGGPGVLKLYDGTAWLTIAAGVAFLPLAGGNILGDLTVNGQFSNPGYFQKLQSGMGATAPASPLPGMLWYDTSVPATPVLKIRGSDNLWKVLVNYVNPSFTQMVTIDGASYAIVNLMAGGENRRIYNDPNSDRITFDSIPQNAATMSIADNGDMYIASLGWIGATLNSKEPTIGFTPIQQTGASLIQLGGSPPSIWAGGVYQGAIRLGQQVNIFAFSAVGSYGRFTSINPTIPGGSDTAAGNLRWGTDSSTMYPSTGTWRNMGSTITDQQSAIFMRVA